MVVIQLSYVKLLSYKTILCIACSELIYVKGLEITKHNAITYKLMIMNINNMNCYARDNSTELNTRISLTY